MKTILEFRNPPVDDRRFDWSAVSEDYEPGDPVGYGATAYEAEADLAGTIADAEDARRDSELDR